MRLTISENKIVEMVYEEISLNYLKEQSIATFCNKYRISETKLTKGFKFLYGITIYAYYLDLRMHYAREELKKGTDVGSVANLLNYSTSSSFTRAFKKIYPRPPSYYRYRND